MIVVGQGPILAVSVAVWQQDRILLVQRGRAPNQGLWALPGGKVEFGETIAHAAIREMLEETGLQIVPQSLFFIQDICTQEFHYSLHCVSAVLSGGRLAAADDAMDAKWVTEAELTQMDLVPNLTSTLTLSKSGPFLPL